MRNKYYNKKMSYKGMTFDSKHELERYHELELLQRAGKISNLQRQAKFELIPAIREQPTECYKKGPNKGQLKPGKVIERAVYYIADFVYTENNKTIVEDAKGVRTKEYIIKRKLMLWHLGIRIREV